MKIYFIKTKPEHESRLEEIGKVVYKSSILQGLYGVESDMDLKDIREKDFVISAREERIGKFI